MDINVTNRISNPLPTTRADTQAVSPSTTETSNSRTRDLVSEEATFESTSAPDPQDDFLSLGRRLRTRRFSSPTSNPTGQSLGLYNDTERFEGIDANQDGRLSVNEAARLESSTLEVGTGQTDAALNFLSKVGDQVTDTNRDEGVFSLEDIAFATDALNQGRSMEDVEQALLSRLNGDAQSTGVALPEPVQFDEEFYLQENPDVAAAVESGAVESGLAHYNQHGKTEGRDPNSGFDEVYYLDNNPDVAEAVEDGLIDSGFAHYQQFGAEENRLPSEDHRLVEESITLDQYITNFVDSEINFGAGDSFSGRDEVLRAYLEQYGVDGATEIAAGSVIDLGPVYDFGRIPPGASAV